MNLTSSEKDGAAANNGEQENDLAGGGITRRELLKALAAGAALILVGCEPDLTPNDDEFAVQTRTLEQLPADWKKELVDKSREALRNITSFYASSGYVPAQFPTADNTTNLIFDPPMLHSEAIMTSLDAYFTGLADGSIKEPTTWGEVDLSLSTIWFEKLAGVVGTDEDNLALTTIWGGSMPWKVLVTWADRAEAPKTLLKSRNAVHTGTNADQILNNYPHDLDVEIADAGQNSHFSDRSSSGHGVRDTLSLGLPKIAEQFGSSQEVFAIANSVTAAHELMHYYDVLNNLDFINHFDNETLARLYALRLEALLESTEMLRVSDFTHNNMDEYLAYSQNITFEGLKKSVTYPLTSLRGDLFDLYRNHSELGVLTDEISKDLYRKSASLTEEELGPVVIDNSVISGEDNSEEARRWSYQQLANRNYLITVNPSINIPSAMRRDFILTFNMHEEEYFAQVTAVVLLIRSGVLDGKITEEEKRVFLESPYGRYVEAVLESLHTD